MAAAQPKPDQNPEERADVFIAEHQQSYSDAISEAREAAKTTDTAAWRDQYARNMKLHREVVAVQLDAIKRETASIKATDTNEDHEKDIRNVVKGPAEERVRFQAWRNRTIEPSESTVEKCQTIRSKALRSAEDAEREQPLVYRGLADSVRARVDKWPAATWDDETGSIAIKEAA